MITFDEDLISTAVKARAAEQRWRPEMTLAVSWICAWQVAHPEARPDYDDGRPDAAMKSMLGTVAAETGQAEREILTSFGAAHCLLCDAVPGFRPVLLSAWDRPDGPDPRRPAKR